MLELRNIKKTFKIEGSNVEALKDVSIKVEDGEIVGIIGSSGAGKSTLLRCINLLERPDEGQVILDGNDITALNDKELNSIRSEMGMIFQHFNLMKQKNVFQNIAFPIKHKKMSNDEINNRVNNLMKLVGIEDKALAYPAQLSGGQKQRVAIARALANNPKILLCDEATSALDPETTKSILKLLKDINKKMKIKIILITHEKDVVKEICNKVYIMADGEVKESGELLEILVNPQTESGINFVGDILKDSNIKKILELEMEQDKESKIYKLTYCGDDIKNAYISIISKEFNVNASILFGNIELIQETIMGVLIIKLTGEEENIEKSKEFFKNHNIVVKEVSK